MEVYDIIHGSIQICPLAKKIIDTFEFQRLRNIKQLGCCNYVFPSSTHTRFEHSIGVYYLARKYIDILNKNGEYFTVRDKDCISIAGLIHDIGHGPYSHLFDELFPEEKNHEYRSGELLKIINKKYDLKFTDDEIKIIIDYIYPKNIEINESIKYKYQIISNNNGIDVDRFDYLTRDIHMTGLNFGIEYKRIIENSKIINGQILYSEKVKGNIQEFFHVRFNMYKDVYNHRTVRGIEFMIKDYLQIHKVNEFISDESIDVDGCFDLFLAMDDNIIYRSRMFAETETEDIKANMIINRINTRDIYKSIGEIIVPNYFEIKKQETDKIIIDVVNINYHTNEVCKYYSERTIINKWNSNKNNIRIITVYYKNKEDKQLAKDKFKEICEKVSEENLTLEMKKSYSSDSCPSPSSSDRS
jgi:deoxynucleoside triphosphate triphosphohydrolase SAMHD1